MTESVASPTVGSIATADQTRLIAESTETTPDQPRLAAKSTRIHCRINRDYRRTDRDPLPDQPWKSGPL